MSAPCIPVASGKLPTAERASKTLCRKLTHPMPLMDVDTRYPTEQEGQSLAQPPECNQDLSYGEVLIQVRWVKKWSYPSSNSGNPGRKGR